MSDPDCNSDYRISGKQNKLLYSFTSEHSGEKFADFNSNAAFSRILIQSVLARIHTSDLKGRLAGCTIAVDKFDSFFFQIG